MTEAVEEFGQRGHYNPLQPRDNHGKWTDTGRGVVAKLGQLVEDVMAGRREAPDTSTPTGRYVQAQIRVRQQKLKAVKEQLGKAREVGRAREVREYGEHRAAIQGRVDESDPYTASRLNSRSVELFREAEQARARNEPENAARLMVESNAYRHESLRQTILRNARTGGLGTSADMRQQADALDRTAAALPADSINSADARVRAAALREVADSPVEMPGVGDRITSGEAASRLPVGSRARSGSVEAVRVADNEWRRDAGGGHLSTTGHYTDSQMRGADVTHVGDGTRPTPPAPVAANPTRNPLVPSTPPPVAPPRTTPAPPQATATAGFQPMPADHFPARNSHLTARMVDGEIVSGEVIGDSHQYPAFITVRTAEGNRRRLTRNRIAGYTDGTNTRAPGDAGPAPAPSAPNTSTPAPSGTPAARARRATAPPPPTGPRTPARSPSPLAGTIESHGTGYSAEYSFLSEVRNSVPYWTPITVTRNDGSTASGRMTHASNGAISVIDADGNRTRLSASDIRNVSVAPDVGVYPSDHPVQVGERWALRTRDSSLTVGEIRGATANSITVQTPNGRRRINRRDLGSFVHPDAMTDSERQAVLARERRADLNELSAAVAANPDRRNEILGGHAHVAALDDQGVTDALARARPIERERQAEETRVRNAARAQAAADAAVRAEEAQARRAENQARIARGETPLIVHPNPWAPDADTGPGAQAARQEWDTWVSDSVNTQLPPGYELRTDAFSAGTYGGGFSGKIMYNGQSVGTINREFRNINGKKTAYHAYFSITPAHRGAGIAQVVNDNLVEMYRVNGVESFSVHANIDVGGYTWASYGYTWNRTNPNRSEAAYLLSRIESEARNWRSPGSTSLNDDAETRRGWQEQIDVWKNAINNQSVTHWPTPLQISRLGKEKSIGVGRDARWPGKSGLLGSSWHGVRYLQDQNGNPLP